MSQPNDELRNEAALLAEALVEGDITAEQAARLEQLAGQSDDARRLVLHYIQLCGELYWDNAASLPRDFLSGIEAAAKEQPVLPPQAETTRVLLPASHGWLPRFWAWAVTACALMVAGLAGWALVRPDRAPVETPSRPVVASLANSVNAEWGGGHGAAAPGTPLVVGEELRLDRGLVQVVFNTGTSVILEAPAVFQPRGVNEALLQSGSLTAKAPPGIVGFTVRTPHASVVDLGTEFGVAAGADGASEIRVFAGNVEVSVPAPTGAVKRQVTVGQAVRASVKGGAATVSDLTASGHAFVRALPQPGHPAGSVAALRVLMESHPHLIHHYPFEGTTRAEKCQDTRGDLGLVEVVMVGGRGGGRIDYAARGFDSTTEAVHPFRAVLSGDTSGVALQSETTFHPPRDMTLEILLRFDAFDAKGEPAIAAAVATRADERNCGFFLVTGDDGHLAHLMDGDASWTETDVPLVPGDWYYVASTFRTLSGKTVIHSYIADVSQHERVLREVIAGSIAPGVPAASRLGIGKAFDWATAHAYPWSGALDELAIYDAILDRPTLQSHLDAIVGE